MYGYLLGYIDFRQVTKSPTKITEQGVEIIHSIVKLLLINKF